MLRRGEDFAGGAGFYDGSVAHDGYARGDLADYGEVVRDKEHGERVRPAELREELQDLRLHSYVERGGWFVGNEETRAIDDGHGNEDALTLAAGKLMRVIAGAADWVGQSYFVHGFVDAGTDLCAG